MRRAIALSLAVCLCLTAAFAPGAAGGKHRKTVIECANKSGTAYKAKHKPSRCVRFGTRGAFAGGVYLTQIRWRHFGAGIVTFTAVECGFHRPCAGIPVTGTVRRPVRRCGHRAYTRLAATSTYGTTRVHMSPCSGRVPLP